MTEREQIYQLWKLLDDIDTLDDAAKVNDQLFRNVTRKLQQKRHQIVSEQDIDALYKEFYSKETP